MEKYGELVFCESCGSSCKASEARMCVMCKANFARNVVVGIATNRVGSVILSSVVTGMQEK